MPNTIQTGRDPFARLTIRKRKHDYKKSCDWCGQANSRGFVWQYFVDADSPRESGDIDGGFCCISCLNVYRY